MNEIDAKFASAHLARFDNPSQLALALISGVEQHNILSFMHFRSQASWIVDPLSGRVVDCLVSFKQLNLLRNWLQQATLRPIHFAEINVTAGVSRQNQSLSAEAHEVLKYLYRQDFELCALLDRTPPTLVASTSKNAKANHQLRRLLIG